MNSESGFQQLWRSPWTGWIGFRYLRSKKNSRFLSFITLLSIVGVALGVTAMIVVLSIMDGFEGETKKRLMSAGVHILVQPTQALPGFDQGVISEAALAPALTQWKSEYASQIKTISPVLSTEAILKSGSKVTGAVIKGLDTEHWQEMAAALKDGAKPDPTIGPGVIVGEYMAGDMGLLAGDPIQLISPTETEGPLGNIPRVKKFQVLGIYHSGLPDQELHVIYSPDRAVRSFLRKVEGVSQWEISVRNFDDAEGMANRLRQLAPGFRVQDWIQLNSHLFASLRLERVAMFVILAFIVVVASFNIVTTLTLMVLEKKKEISILKTIGARHGQVAAIFLAEGLLIGTLGIGGGIGIGFILCLLLKRYEFISLPDVYYDRTLPVTFDPKFYLLVAVCAWLIVLVACLYPSRRAARINPMDGIRFG